MQCIQSYYFCIIASNNSEVLQYDISIKIKQDIQLLQFYLLHSNPLAYSLFSFKTVVIAQPLFLIQSFTVSKQISNSSKVFGNG